MAEKAPYKLTIKLESARPDALGEGLAKLREIAGEYDQTGEGSASITIEGWQEQPLSNIMGDFEEWLWQHKIGIGCEMKVARPGIRPEMIGVLRARHETPMDQQGWEGDEASEPLITPPPITPGELLQLMPPADWVEGEVIIEEQGTELERALDEADEERRIAAEELRPIGSDAPPALAA